MLELAAIAGAFAKKKKEETFIDGGGSDAPALFYAVYFALLILAWGVAFYKASACTDTAVNYIIAFLFPLLYILVRILAPCKK